MQHSEEIQRFRRSLRKLERETGLELSEETECCSITVPQCHLLLETELRGETSIQDMADILVLDKSTMSRTTENLVKCGLIKRTENDSDRRRVSLTLTETGKKTCERINALCNAQYATIFEHIDEDKRESVMEAVELLAHAMEKVRKTREKTCCVK